MSQVQVKSAAAERATFGIEIECFVPSDKIRRIGGYHRGAAIGGRFPRGWRAERDGSLSTRKRGYVPVEIVSPVLRGADGLAQVRKVARILKEWDARVNPTCGFHVHVGVESLVGNDANRVADLVRRMLNLAAHHELAIYGASGTKRRLNGRWSASLKNGRWAQKKESLRKKINDATLRRLSCDIGRYQLLNVSPLYSSKRTVEFRAFAGTMEEVKMVSYIQVALAIATRAMDHNANFDGVNARYASDGAKGAMKRFFYLMGWTRGRKDWALPECTVEGWIADLADLKPVKKELMRLARKFDEAA